ncbi:MAG: hypothetical protein WED00_01720 [Aquisalimonadaceae bacterium]
MTDLARLLQRRWASWLLGMVVFTLLYHLMLFAAVVLRFGEWPNYAVRYEVVRDIGLIVKGTPSLADAIVLLIRTPWLEAGYRNAEYFGIAEWSFLVMPATLLQVMALGGLLTATWLLLKEPHRRLGTGVGTSAFTGATLTGITGATLTAVSCSTSPSWVVLLTLFGLSNGHALALETLGPWLRLTGLLLLAGSLLVTAVEPRRARRQPAASQIQEIHS